MRDGRESGLEPGYDRILVDAPCSGLGALRRRPEARWRRQPSDVADLTKLQGELITAAYGLRGTSARAICATTRSSSSFAAIPARVSPERAGLALAIKSLRPRNRCVRPPTVRE